MSHRDGRDEPGGADEVASARDVRAEHAPAPATPSAGEERGGEPVRDDVGGDA